MILPNYNLSLGLEQSEALRISKVSWTKVAVVASQNLNKKQAKEACAKPEAPIFTRLLRLVVFLFIAPSKIRSKPLCARNTKP